MYNYNRNSHVHNALQKIMWRNMWSFQKCAEKKHGSTLRLLFIYLHQNLFNIKKHLALALKKIVHVLNCVFQSNLNKVVNIFCTLSKWIRNVQIMQCFSTIKIWMRILHG